MSDKKSVPVQEHLEKLRASMETDEAQVIMKQSALNEALLKARVSAGDYFGFRCRLQELAYTQLQEENKKLKAEEAKKDS
jgi:hypothetical protein